MPEVIASGATALEVIADAIAAAGIATEGADLWLGQELDGEVNTQYGTHIPDACVVVTEGDGLPSLTMGTAVALENPTVQVQVRGAVGDYLGPKKVALDIRYSVAALKDYTSRGVRLLSAPPLGSLLPLGPDANGRHRFTVKFTATTDPSYTP